MKNWYEHYVQDRSVISFLGGGITRFLSYLKYRHYVRIARLNGAVIGEGVVMTRSFAKKCNGNVKIGNHVSIETDMIDVRAPITIGDHVIIGRGTEILTVSHYIDSPEFDAKYYGLVIEDYVWLPTKVLVLPSCRRIGRGAVVGSGSVVVKSVEPMSVVSGNPAKEIKKRVCVHSNLVVERLRHGDYKAYIATYKEKNGKSDKKDKAVQAD